MNVKGKLMAECGCEVEIKEKEQGRLLIILLSINAIMFFVEFGTGILADSTGLIADSLDMLADAAVYGIALYAVGHSAQRKAMAAHMSGLFQIVLAVGVAMDVVRRFIFGSEPESVMMMAIGTVALAANVTCLTLISKHREGEVHMRASWIFSKNDVLANLGIILGGVLVAASGSRLPDLLIGAVITVIVLRGGLHIIKDAAAERRKVLPDGT
jgi:cation diffusion facilitator family transporter